MYLFYFMKYLLTIQTVTRALSTTTASETNIYQLLDFVAAKNIIIKLILLECLLRDRILGFIIQHQQHKKRDGQGQTLLNRK